MNRKIITVLVLIILAFIVGMFIGRLVFTARVVETNILENYSWTKAICNSDNECLDVLIKCEAGKIVGIEPVSGIVKHDANWKDPREGMKNKLC